MRPKSVAVRTLALLSLLVTLATGADGNGSPMFGRDIFFNWEKAQVPTIWVDRDGLPNIQVSSSDLVTMVSQASSAWGDSMGLGVSFPKPQLRRTDIATLQHFEEFVPSVPGIHVIVDNREEIFNSRWVGQWQRINASAVCIMNPELREFVAHFQSMAVVIRPSRIGSRQELLNLLAHELGHCQGLEHTQVGFRSQQLPLMSPSDFSATPRADDFAWQAWLYHRQSDSFRKHYSVIRGIVRDSRSSRPLSGVHIVAAGSNGTFGAFSLEPQKLEPTPWNFELPVPRGTYQLSVQPVNVDFLLTINQSGPIAARAKDKPGFDERVVNPNLVVDDPFEDAGSISISRVMPPASKK